MKTKHCEKRSRRCWVLNCFHITVTNAACRLPPSTQPPLAREVLYGSLGMVGRCLWAEVRSTVKLSVSDHPKCEDIVVAYENRTIGGLYEWKIIKSSSQKVVAVAYERRLFTWGSNCRALTGQILVFCICGRLRELVAHWSSTVRSSQPVLQNGEPTLVTQFQARGKKNIP